MPTEARITSIWSKQKGFLVIFLTAVGLWFLFDGLAGFPRSNERWLSYEQFKNEHRLPEWPAYAKIKGWNEVPPHKFYKKLDINLQYIIGALTLSAGIWAFIYRSRQMRHVFRLENDAVVIPGGQRVPLQSITGLNKKKWEAKGLATVFYSVDGRRGKFILDDYKFDCDPIHEIMTAIERRPDQPSA